MAIQLGGLATGMDTQTIIETLMTQAKQPLLRLEDEKTAILLKKSIFESVEDDLTTFRRSLLTMRLESTYKSKLTSTSDSTALSADATVEAQAGTYSLEIDQVASPAIARSLFTRASLATEPANSIGVESVSGRPTDNLEGTHEITITNQGTYYRARSEFEPSGGGSIRTLSGTTEMESSLNEGTIGTTIDSSNNVLRVTLAGETVEVTLDSATADVTATARVAADIEDKLNEALNTAKDTQGVTYVAVRTSRDASTDSDQLMIYDLSGTATAPVIETVANTAATALGFGASSPYGISGTASRIITDVTATSLENLAIEINEVNTGLIRGVTFSVEDDGLTTGDAYVHTNAGLNALGAVPSIVYGAEDVSSASGGLDTMVVGLENAGFDETPSSSTNGTFTINGAEITINNYQSLSVDAVLGLINGSAAGVTATYDEDNDRILLTSNEDTGSAITLGDTADTSDFLTIAKLTSVQGASSSVGSYGGGISTSSALDEAGLTLTPTSGTFTINGVTLFVESSSDTIQDVVDLINNSSAGVTASYDTITDKFSLRSKMGTVSTNADKIELGSVTDSSNILRALNLVDDLTPSYTSASVVSGVRADQDTISITRTGYSTPVEIYVPAALSTGAYQETAGTINWIDGIDAGSVFNVLAGDTGTSGATWTNSLTSAITDIDTFISEWNDSGNWSTGYVEVGVIKEGDDQLRFFNRSDGDGASGASFAITAPNAYDLYELGLAAPGASSAAFTNTDSGVDAEYNALVHAFAINQGGSIAKARTDDSGHLILYSNTVGYYGGFTAADSASGDSVASYFGTSSVQVSADEDVESGTRGQDAVFTVDGVGYTRSTNTVDDVIGGVTLKLQAPSSGPVTLTIENDTEKAVDALVDFIVQYNETLELLNPPILDDDQRKYLDPLTDDEKLDMTVNEYEEYMYYYTTYNSYQYIRKEGSLRLLYSDMRSYVSGTVDGLGNSLNSLSLLDITAGSIGGFEDAKDGYLLLAPTGEDDYADTVRDILTSNSTLMEALEEDADSVYKLFALEGDDDESTDDDGIARRIDTLLDNYVGSDGILTVQTESGGSFEDRVTAIGGLNDRIDNVERRLELLEERLWTKFNAMEETVAKLQKQQESASAALESAGSASLL